MCRALRVTAWQVSAQCLSCCRLGLTDTDVQKDAAVIGALSCVLFLSPRQLQVFPVTGAAPGADLSHL